MEKDQDERRRLALTRERFNTVRTLQRNFDACCEVSLNFPSIFCFFQAAKCSQEPADRMRHNEPHGASPWEPDCRDLGYVTREMAKSIEGFSQELARLSGESNSANIPLIRKTFYLISRSNAQLCPNGMNKGLISFINRRSFDQTSLLIR